MNIKEKQSLYITYIIFHKGETYSFPNYENVKTPYWSATMFGMVWNKDKKYYEFKSIIVSKPIYWKLYNIQTYTYMFRSKEETRIKAIGIMAREFSTSFALVEILPPYNTQKIIHKRKV